MRGRRLRSLLLLVVVAALIAPGDARARAALRLTRAPASRCSGSPIRIRTLRAIPVVAIACGVLGGAADIVGGVAGDVVGGIGNSVLDGVATWVGQGSAWLINRIAKLVERSTRPELGSARGSRAQYRGMLSLALLLALAFLLAAMITAALRQDPAMAVRAAFVSLPLAICACFAAVTLVEMALAATDGATRMLTSQAGGDSQHFFGELAKIVSPGRARRSRCPASSPCSGAARRAACAWWCGSS